MNQATAGCQLDGACAACRGRSWLLGDLSALLDYHRGDPLRLAELLSLTDEELIDALAGKRREELKRNLRQAPAPNAGDLAGGGDLCVHARTWPARLQARSTPRMLWLSGSPAIFSTLTGAPTVALLGGTDASPYGAEMAAGLARGLTAAGVTVISGLAGGLSRAAHLGALEVEGASLAVAGSGLGQIRPAGADRVARAIRRRGCVVQSSLRRSVDGWVRSRARSPVASLVGRTH
jgi:DNA processing protein